LLKKAAAVWEMDFDAINRWLASCTIGGCARGELYRSTPATNVVTGGRRSEDYVFLGK
jgi:hypothetical protein